MIDLLVCNLNPAWDKVVTFAKLKVNDVNRCQRLRECGAGKGANMAYAAHQQGCSTTSIQFIGGHTGYLLENYLHQEGIETISVQVDDPVRTCTTVICKESGTATELIEPSAFIPEEAAAELLSKVKAVVANHKLLAFCGSYPLNIPEDYYSKIAESATNQIIFADTVKGLTPLMKSCVVDVLKINIHELEVITGESNQDLAAASLLNAGKIKYLAVTAGPGNAFLYTRESKTTYEIPLLEENCQPIGAGDCAAGVMASHLCKNTGDSLNTKQVETAFRHGIAAASASCLHELPAHYAPETAAQIFAQIKMT